MRTFKKIFLSNSISERIPNLRELQRIHRLSAIKEFLPKHIRDEVICVYTKGNRVLIAIRSVSMCSEYNKFFARDNARLILSDQSVKTALNIENCNEIVAYVPKHFMYLYRTYERSFWVVEKSTGRFTNFAKDDSLHRLFEELRSVILSRLREQEEGDYS